MPRIFLYSGFNVSTIAMLLVRSLKQSYLSMKEGIFGKFNNLYWSLHIYLLYNFTFYFVVFSFK